MTVYCMVDVDGTLINQSGRLNEALIATLLELQKKGAVIQIFSSMEVRVETMASSAADAQSGENMTRSKLIAELEQRGLMIRGLTYPAAFAFKERVLGEAFKKLFPYHPAEAGPRAHLLQGIDPDGRLLQLDDPSMEERQAVARLRLNELFDLLSQLYLQSLFFKQLDFKVAPLFQQNFFTIQNNFLTLYENIMQANGAQLFPQDLQEKLSQLVTPIAELINQYPAIRESRFSDLTQQDFEKLSSEFIDRAKQLSPSYTRLYDGCSELMALYLANQHRIPEKMEMYCSLLDQLPLTPQDSLILFDDKPGVLESILATHRDLGEPATLHCILAERSHFKERGPDCYGGLLSESKKTFLDTEAESILSSVPRLIKIIAPTSEFGSYFNENIACLTHCMCTPTHPSATDLNQDHLIALSTHLKSLLPKKELEASEIDITKPYLEGWLFLAEELQRIQFNPRLLAEKIKIFHEITHILTQAPLTVLDPIKDSLTRYLNELTGTPEKPKNPSQEKLQKLNTVLNDLIQYFEYLGNPSPASQQKAQQKLKTLEETLKKLPGTVFFFKDTAGKKLEKDILARLMSQIQQATLALRPGASNDSFSSML